MTDGNSLILPQQDIIQVLAETTISDIVWDAIASFAADFRNPGAARLFADWGREFGLYAESTFSNFRPEASDDVDVRDVDLLPDPIAAGPVTVPTFRELYIGVSPTYAVGGRRAATPAVTFLSTLTGTSSGHWPKNRSALRLKS